MERKKNIFALEGEWERKLDNPTSIEATLQFLKVTMNVKYIFRKVATQDNFLFYLKKATQKQYSDYKIIYLAFHGVNTVSKVHRNTVENCTAYQREITCCGKNQSTKNDKHGRQTKDHSVMACREEIGIGDFF